MLSGKVSRFSRTSAFVFRFFLHPLFFSQFFRCPGQAADQECAPDKTMGSLEPGKYADFLMIDPTRLGAVLEDPYANLVLVTGERDIDRVFVEGDLKVDHGQVLHQDIAEIEKEVSRRVAMK
jgi:hypothetical protein